MRTFAIWAFGLLAAGIIGSLIGTAIDRYDGGFLGFIGGVCVFACVRLLLTGRRSASPSP